MSGEVLGERHQGPWGWAQHVRVPDHPATATTVASWFMHLPHQAPNDAWDKYVLSVVTLDDAPGMPTPIRRYPEAEFELVVITLSPAHGPRPDDVETWHPMLPVNVVEQFHGVTGEQAARMAKVLAQECVHGGLPAETQILFTPADGSEPRMMVIEQLMMLWNTAVRQLVEHEQTGGLHSRMN